MLTPLPTLAVVGALALLVVPPAPDDAGGTVLRGDAPAALSGLAPSAPVPSAPGYRAPLADPALLTRFDPPTHRWGAGHRGVDLAASGGETVLAPGAGTVTFSGTVVDRGVLTVTHPDGLRSSLEPVTDALPTGTVVEVGDPVAVVGHGGHCGARCLHWGVRRGSTYLDPLDLLPGGGPVVLLPREP